MPTKFELVTLIDNKTLQRQFIYIYFVLKKKIFDWVLNGESAQFQNWSIFYFYEFLNWLRALGGKWRRSPLLFLSWREFISSLSLKVVAKLRVFTLTVRRKNYYHLGNWANWFRWKIHSKVLAESEFESPLELNHFFQNFWEELNFTIIYLFTKDR